MSNYFRQIDYSQLVGIDGKEPISEAGSFLVAQCNLLKIMNLGHDIDPAALNDFYRRRGVYETRGGEVRDRLDWKSISKFDSTVSAVKIDRGWPSEKYVIAKFHFQSTSKPVVVVDGVEQPNFMSHFCVVIDPEKKLIIDSYDGDIKEAGPYGTPIAYAAYTSPEINNKPPTSKTSSTYTWVKHDNIWDVARRLGFGGKELMEHNDITDPNAIQPGEVLHLPVPKELPPDKPVRYEILPEPRLMHVTKPGGAKKWSFGNVSTWDDLITTGPTYQENANVSIVAIAHVPIGEDEAAYYMDALSLGSYASTGRVNYTVGFNWKHLADGLYVPPEPLPVPTIAEERLAEQLKPDPALALAPVKRIDITPPKPSPNSYKASIRALYPDARVVTYVAAEDINVEEMDGRRAPHLFRKNHIVKVRCTFEKDGVTYALPVSHEKSGYWFGIPMDYLIEEDELHTVDIDRPTQIAYKRSTGRHLSIEERGVEAFSKTVAYFVRKKSKLTQKQN